jgi:hypothetical protein
VWRRRRSSLQPMVTPETGDCAAPSEVLDGTGNTG